MEGFSKVTSSPVQPAGYRSDYAADKSAKDGTSKQSVFILHTNSIGDPRGRAVLKLAVKLREMCVDVSLDLFEYDTPPKNWSAWYEQKLRQSDIILCMIDEMFYHNLISGNRVVGYTVYNLMNNPSVDVSFRAVFLDMPKKIECVPPAMQGATSYSISSSCLGVESEEFANLYAYLTGQNRIQKPALGKMVKLKLAPKTPRFGQQQQQEGWYMPTTDRYMQQQMQLQTSHGQSTFRCEQSMNTTTVQDTNSSQANRIYNFLRDDATQISVLPSHQKMLMSLAMNLLAEWEALGRMLNINEAELYAIKKGYMYSVQEQAVQMLRKWLDKNGSKATLGLLITVVYSLGPNYWNLLDILNEHACT